MSKPYKVKCPYCKGTGEQNPPNVLEGCPHCSEGWIGLKVECEKCGGTGKDCCIQDTDCDNINHYNCRITERQKYPSGSFNGITSCKGYLPCTCTDGYRPLTGDEVEELVKAVRTYPNGKVLASNAERLAHLVMHAKSEIVTFKGSPVTIGRIE